MSEYLNVSVVFKRIMKFWYLTMILPILFAGTAFYFVGKYQDANPEYAASAAFVVATKNDDSIANQAQSRIYSQNYADELVGTIGELARSRNVLSKAVMSVDGNNTYTTQQLQYIEVPQLASQVTVVKEISSMICNVTVTDESAK